MKVTMEFDLSTERAEYESAMNGHGYRVALGELADWLRRQYKYGAGELSLGEVVLGAEQAEQIRAAVAMCVREMLFELLDEEGVEL